ncbi:MAG: hypothetical protein V2J07_06215 [Anaerolineae bacterium]|jgi:NADH:ubiquinone oxidoreductase subunit 3 (subunit A)|nr:hypothetical protein [Anaerolineae bacterium]
MKTLLLNPVFVFLFFLSLITGGYLVLLRFTDKGQPHPSKHQPYTGGQDFPTPDVQLSYQAFFRIGLLFGILHVTALVLSLLPLEWAQHQIGLLYLVGITISAYVLARPDGKGE